MKIIPNNGYLLIKPYENEEKTESGIFLSTSNQDRPQRGTIISMGEPYVHESGQLVGINAVVGQEVLYKKWGGNEVKLNRTDVNDLLLVRFDDVMAMLENEKD